MFISKAELQEMRYRIAMLELKKNKTVTIEKAKTESLSIVNPSEFQYITCSPPSHFSISIEEAVRLIIEHFDFKYEELQACKKLVKGGDIVAAKKKAPVVKKGKKGCM